MATLSGVHTIDQTECLDLYKFTCEAGTNTLVLGPAGGGKTAMAQQAATEMGFPHIYVDLSVLEAPDFVGLPTISTNERGAKVVEYATPKFMPCKDVVDVSQKPFVLIFDELDKSRPELQAPLLEIFHERSINGRPLHVHGILATGNLPDEGAFSQPISHALTNRCSVYKMELNFEAWQPWAVKNSINPLIVGFLSRNPEWLLKPPPEGDPTAYCHPSPRAWSNSARDLDKAGRRDVDFQTKLVSGRVGTGAAAKFRVWLDHYRHIEPFVDALVKDGKHPPDMSIDKLIVCAISACSQIARTVNQVDQESKKGSKKDADKVYKVTEHVMKWLATIDTEFQIAAVKNSLDMDMIRDWGLTKVPGFMEVVNRTRNVIKGK
jgi:hypothetical protein